MISPFIPLVVYLIPPLYPHSNWLSAAIFRQVPLDHQPAEPDILPVTKEEDMQALA